MTESSDNKQQDDKSSSGPRGNNQRKGATKKNAKALTYNKWKCTTPELEGYIYDKSGYGQTEQFTRTTDRIGEYAATTFKHSGDDVRKAIENKLEPMFVEPADPVDPTNPLAFKRWSAEYDKWNKSQENWKNNNSRLFNIVRGQCTEAMKQELDSNSKYPAISSSSNGIALINLLREIMFDFKETKYHPLAVYNAVFNVYKVRQHRSTLNEYYDRFKNQIEVATNAGGNFSKHPGLIDVTNPGADGEKFMAIAFILGANKERYHSLWADLRNNFALGQDKYPKTLNDAFNALQQYRPQSILPTTELGASFHTDGIDPDDPDQDIALYQKGDFKPKGDSKPYKQQQKNRKKKTTTADDPPDKKGTQLTQDSDTQQDTPTAEDGIQHLISAAQNTDGFEEFAFAQQANVCHIENAIVAGSLPSGWILLDNQSTCDVFSNGKLLRNIRRNVTSLRINCNAGSASTNLIGDLPGYGTVWYHPKGIANILSLAKVKSRYRVTYDSQDDNTFVVHKKDGTTREFVESAKGLYYHDAALNDSDAHVLVTTVDGNKSKYTNRDYSQAVLARKLQRIMQRPSTKDFLRLIDENLIPNCPITRADVVAAEHIFGPDVGSLRGKTVRRTPATVAATNISIPPEILARYHDIVLCTDIMTVNRNVFLITRSRAINFATAEALHNMQLPTLLKALQRVINLYRSRGFKANMLLSDGQFEPLRDSLRDNLVQLNATSRDEHVGDIERFLRTVKERTRATWNTLPFKRIPARMTIELVCSVIFWLNSLPGQSGLSKVLSPRAIMTGQSINYTKHCVLEYGAYVQTHEEHDNSMQSRTTGAIALRPTGNEQGGFYFMSLSTGRRINRNRWTELPMPQDVIDRVHQLARQQQANPGLVFLDINGQPEPDPDDAMDDDNDSAYVPEPEEMSIAEDSLENASIANDEPEPDLYPHHLAGVNEPAVEVAEPPIQIPGVHHENEPAVEDEEPPIPGVHPEHEPVDDNEPAVDGEEPPIAGVHHENEPVNDNEPAGEELPPEPPIAEHVEEQNPAANDEIGAAEQEEPMNTVEDEMNARYGERSGQYDLRPRRTRTFEHLFAMIDDEDQLIDAIIQLNHDDSDAQFDSKQYFVNKGLKVFGKSGEEAVEREIKQLHDLKVMEPVDPDTLSRGQKQQALRYLMFLKRKMCGRVKGRGCADGSTQRGHISKDESSSPTVALESVMLSCAIDAKENRDVATVDIPGAFMQADNDQLVHMKLEGRMAELLTKVDPVLYRKYVKVEGSKKVLYVVLRKALYGQLRAALLFWQRLSAQLVEWGFTINPYDWCVANKIINGKQCTILWHVDDLKISHIDSDVVSMVISDLESQFGLNKPLTVTRGTCHDYLGMHLSFKIPGKVQITMKDYIKKMLHEIDDDPTMAGEAPTPAAHHLFTVNEKDPSFLSEQEATDFHHVTAKLLFLCKRARPDTQTSVSFLCTRVKRPDQDDKKKLNRVMKYLRSTQDMPLTLDAHNMLNISWWIDASYAVHPDMKSHTGAVMTLGSGAFYGTSTRQKLNTRSSTEAELVGVNDAMSQVLWTRYFLEAQGYPIKSNVVYQDNHSAMLLEKNGKGSSSKRTRHIDIRYFFVTDRIKSGEIQVQYCPTQEMLADFFTKPLQGSLFIQLRNRIMNYDPKANVHGNQDHRSVLNINNDVSTDESEWTVVRSRKQKSMRS